MISESDINDIVRQVIPKFDDQSNRNVELMKLEGWNSLNFVKIVMLLEVNYGVELDPINLASVKTYADLLAVVKGTG
ncbi:hypothetical protein OAQ35_04045 [Litorivicinus sp.]|nr:hypothetical protein [Litorivicinus sp.]